MRLHAHKLSETMSSIYTHAGMWLSDKVRPDSPSLQEGRPCVSACASWDSDFWMTLQDNRHKTQQITEQIPLSHVPVQISHIFYLFKGLMVSEQKTDLSFPISGHSCVKQEGSSCWQSSMKLIVHIFSIYRLNSDAWIRSQLKDVIDTND